MNGTTTERLVAANSELKTIDIKGKAYVPVNERLKAFRKHFPELSLITDIISLQDGVCIMQAKIMTPDGLVIATGTAYEREDSSYINKTSYIENCESSSWGRAMGNFGIGIDASIGSADEVANAIRQQDELVSDKEKASFIKMCNNAGVIPEDVLKQAGWKSGPLTKTLHGKALRVLMEIEKNA